MLTLLLPGQATCHQPGSTLLGKHVLENGNGVVGNTAVPNHVHSIAPQANHHMRHTVGLYHGQQGSKEWKRYLSDNMMARDSDFQKAKHIMDIAQNNEKANQLSV